MTYKEICKKCFVNASRDIINKTRYISNMIEGFLKFFSNLFLYLFSLLFLLTFPVSVTIVFIVYKYRMREKAIKKRNFQSKETRKN